MSVGGAAALPTLWAKGKHGYEGEGLAKAKGRCVIFFILVAFSAKSICVHYHCLLILIFVL